MEMVEVIKKYTNRKLYSTKTSSYVKLPYLADLIKTKQKFMVIDNKTKKDITTQEKIKALQHLDSDDSILDSIFKGIK